VSSHPTPTLSLTSDESAEAGTTFADGPAIAVGARLGRYVELRKIGEGGMGVVYSARDEILARQVALKLVRTDSSGSGAQARMLREAQALARLSHPNVVQIYEVSAAGGQVFLAMEHIEGDTLRGWTRAWRARGGALRELLDVCVQAGEGLAAAHAAGLVHRDFKPDNVLVGVDGRARVVDFGLVTAPPRADAGTAADGSRVEFTAAGGLLGTPAYMSPEQFAGRGADARSDQFSYCVVLYEAVCGGRPFAGASVEELRGVVLAGELRPPPPELPAWLWAVLRRGLAADPGDRFPTLAELLVGLGRDPAALRRRRRRVAGLVSLGAVAAVLLALLVQDLRQRWQRRAHEQAAARDLGATEGRLLEARQAGDRAGAGRLFAGFVDDPLHAGTTALARAWLAEAGRREADGSREGVRAALASAYLEAPEEALQGEALARLVRHFHGGLESDAFAGAFAQLQRSQPALAGTSEFAALGVEAALARRDLVGAGEAAADAPRLAPLVAALSGAAATGYQGIYDVLVHGSQVLLLELVEGRPVVHVATMDAALTPEHRVAMPAGTRWVKFVGADPFLLVAIEAGGHNVLYRLADGRLTALDRWDGGDAQGSATADLDGDGARELYVSTGTGLSILELSPDRDGVWSHRSVYTPADTLLSGAPVLVALDLDGDGREELGASFGGWRAFDVRVLQREPGSGQLRTLARDKLGSVHGVRSLRSDETLLLAANQQFYESSLVFPPDARGGVASGLYLYGFDGAGLHLRDRLAVGVGGLWDLAVGDVDGDGREDAVTRRQEARRDHTLLHLQDPDGGFSQVEFGHFGFRQLAQLDADPALELIGEIEDDDHRRRIWVVGAGGDALPLVALAGPEAPVLVDPDDAAWTRQAGRAGTLEQIGLVADAAAAFAELGVQSSRPELRARAFHRAADLRERVGHHREAAELYLRAAADPSLAALALPGRLRAQLRTGAYEAAAVSLVAARALPELAPDTRAELARYGGLASVDAPTIDLDFRGPLASGLEFPDPLAVRREADGLTLATSAPGVLMSLPIAWSGELLELSADITVSAAEWGAGIEIAVVPEDDLLGPPLMHFGVSSAGTSRGGVTVLREYSCNVAGRRLNDDGPHDLLADGFAAAPRRELRVALTPMLDELGCDIHEPGATRTRQYRRREAVALPPSERHRLVVRWDRQIPAWIELRVHRISLHGARVRDVPAADPVQRELERSVIAGDAVATLAALAAGDRDSPRARVWRADALLQLGRRPEADAVWSTLLAADPLEPTLAARLRGEPARYGPLLHALDPQGHPRRLVDLWRNSAANHLGDPRVRQALAAALAALDGDAALAGARDDDDREAVALLLGWRGCLWLRADEPVRARADLERGLAIVAGLGPEAARREPLWMMWIELATLATGDGDLVGALAAIERARASSGMPALVDDIVRARPALAAIAGLSAP
jgi:hypothetical protein